MSKKKSDNQQPISPIIVVREGRDEMNLAEFPFALLSDRVPEGVKTLRFTDTIAGKDNKPVTRFWTVTGSDEWGLPVAADECVYVALLEVTKEQGFRSRKVPFTRYDLIKRLGWPYKGDSFERLELALKRLVGVSIVAENAFWDKAKQVYVDAAFHILDAYALYNEPIGRKSGKQLSSPSSFIMWNEIIFASFLAGNIKYLDTEFYFSLRSALARRIYRYLDKKFYDGKEKFTIGLRKFAFEKIGLSRPQAAYPSWIKQKLSAALNELIERGFLSEVTYDASRSEEDERIIFHRGQKRARKVLPSLSAAAEETAVKALVAQGVTEKIAQNLASRFAPELIQFQIEVLPYREAKERAAVLVKSIEDNWAPPDKYKAARAQREHERQAQTERQKEEEAQAAATLLAQRVQEILVGLSDEDLADIRERAVARISPKIIELNRGKIPESLLEVNINAIIKEEYLSEVNGKVEIDENER